MHALRNMDLPSNLQNEPGRMEQIISQFLLKSLHIILDSRIPSLRPHNRTVDMRSVSRVKKSDKWFSLVLSDHLSSLDNLNFWHRNSMDPMIIDIILVHEGSGSSYVDKIHTPTSVETVIERWVVQYESPRIVAPQTGDYSAYYKKTYKKSIIFLRSLYSMMRLLPAYRIFRQLISSSQTYNFDIIYKVSSFSDPFSRPEEEAMQEYNFVPVEALPGHLCISVTYRPTLSDFNLEPSTSLPPMIITDYIGSPATDPLRAFSSTEMGVSATSFPLRDARVPPFSAQFQRPHSWTSGFHKETPFVQNQSLISSPPLYHSPSISADFPSPSPPDIYADRIQMYRSPTQQKATSFDKYQISPPLSSSPSPSPPTYRFSGNPIQTRLRSETAPVTIPLPVMGRSSKYLSPSSSDPNRHSLPPLSPRNIRRYPSSLESLSGIKSIRKTDSSRIGELCTGIANNSSSPKVVKDSEDDSGRLLGLLSSSGSARIGFSRSSSRLSFQDESEDFDFSCPFDVDDVDASDAHVRKSQDAAVGVLVHMLRTAPPLRQHQSCYPSHLLKTEFRGDVSTVSGFFLPRKASDALEELKSYKEMKDLLLSNSGTQEMSQEEA